MGRPTKHPSKKLKRQVIAKVTDSEKRRIAKTAKRKRMSESEYLRACESFAVHFDIEFLDYLNDRAVGL